MNEILLELIGCIRVASITDRIHAVFQHAQEIGAVRIVTGRAFASGKRLMNILALQRLFSFSVAGITEFGAGRYQELFIGGCMGLVTGEAPLSFCHCAMLDAERSRLVLMTIKAEIVPFFIQQLLVLRRMRRMTGEAIPSLERLMLHRACLQGLGVMALITEFAPLLGNIKRFWRRGRIVAAVTSRCGNRIMHGRFQELGQGRGMRVVTGRAFFAFDRIIAMGLPE